MCDVYGWIRIVVTDIANGDTNRMPKQVPPCSSNIIAWADGGEKRMGTLGYLRPCRCRSRGVDVYNSDILLWLIIVSTNTVETSSFRLPLQVPLGSSNIKGITNPPKNRTGTIKISGHGCVGVQGLTSLYPSSNTGSK